MNEDETYDLHSLPASFYDSFVKIELTWPEKERGVEQLANGMWRIVDRESITTIRPLNILEQYGDSGNPSMLIEGDRLLSLDSLRKCVPHQINLVYADVPRIEGFDESRSFQAESDRVWRTWLSVVREHFARAFRLLDRTGIFVAQVGDREEPFVKLILQELFGLQNYVGSMVWQSHYSPKGGKASKEVAPIHEYLICYASDLASIDRVSVPIKIEGYSNKDGDPRGDWEAKQKDAGRDTVKITYNVPPYRWTKLSGNLPPGLWRVSPMSGVIWGTPEKEGNYTFVVEVKDSAGKSSSASITIRITRSEEEETDINVTDPWWVMLPPRASDTSPKIGQPREFIGFLGHSFSTTLTASGGTPFKGSPRPKRGWGFGQATLNKAILADACWFGTKGDAIPEPKRYTPPDGKRGNVSSWWGGELYGWTQDATKHLNNLKDAGLIKEINPTAKPESLLASILDVFSSPGSRVLELFCKSGDLSAVALKKQRLFVALAGSSISDVKILEDCTLGRLDAVVKGLDCKQSTNENSTAKAVCLSHEGGGGFFRMVLGQPLAVLHPSEEIFSFTNTYQLNSVDFLRAILSSEGYLPIENSFPLRGLSHDGLTVGVIIGVDEFLTEQLADETVSSHTGFASRLVIYYFRSSEDFSSLNSHQNVTFKRLPMDISA